MSPARVRGGQYTRQGKKHGAGSEATWYGQKGRIQASRLAAPTSRITEFSPHVGLAVDTTGVYVAGIERPLRFVRKFSPDGAELWTSRMPQNPGLLELPSGVAVDATGVFVLERIASRPAGLMRKYDTCGNELWARQLDFQPGGAAAAQPTGLFVTGDNALLRKYDADGNELWIRRITLPKK